jgi:hypothetical protein
MEIGNENTGMKREAVNNYMPQSIHTFVLCHVLQQIIAFVSTSHQSKSCFECQKSTSKLELFQTFDIDASYLGRVRML